MMDRNTPAFFKRGPRLLLRLIFFMVLSLALLFADARFNALVRVREPLSVVLHPLQWIATAPLRFILFSRDFFVQRKNLLQENRRLADESLVMKAKLMQLEQLQVENTTLRNMFKLAQREKMTSVLARIRYYGYDPFSDKLSVDRGEKDGVKAGQAVLDASGLLGQVIRAQRFSSEIRLIVDKDFPVPVMVLRNELRAIIYGGVIPNTMEIRFLPFNSDIKVGDKLVTSGLEGVYPTGIPVARVKSIEISPGSIFARIICEPFAKPQTERYVLIVTNHSNPFQIESASAPQARTETN
jgi:rod shape-determining protein MreC